PSLQILESLNIRTSGEQKLSIFPSWVLSTSLQTAGKRYPFISLPLSEWYINGNPAETIETAHTPGTVHDLVDGYYNLGGLINLYNHGASGGPLANGDIQDYITYARAKTNMWPVNSADLYDWWVLRSNVSINATCATNGTQSITTLTISGSVDPQTSVEFILPHPSVSSLQVFTNGVAAGAGAWRTNGQTIKIRVGTTVTNAQVRFILNPEAQPFTYSVAAGAGLNVAAPGILAGAVTGAGASTQAVLVGAPSHGSLSLSADGSFVYTPVPGFSGVDTFTYQVDDGVSLSPAASVTISVIPSLDLFVDDFSRATNADVLAPWVIGVGKWTITNGVMLGASSGMRDYSDCYVPGNWTNFSIQTRLQLPEGAWAGGLDGRVNPNTGAKYTLNVYPENSGGSIAGAPVLKLLKFDAWRDYTETVMQQALLPPVGTNWHTVKLTFRGNQIYAYFDGVLLLNVADNSFGGFPAWTSGAAALHMFTYQFGYEAVFDDFIVSTLAPVAGNDAYSMVENRTLTVAAPGVLANDTPGVGTNLTAVLSTTTTHGTLSLNTNGAFTYTPSANYIGTDSFSYVANDGFTNSDPATVTITVVSNIPPVANNDSFNGVQNRTLNVSGPGVLANDTDANGDSLAVTLVSGPAHGSLTLNPNGGFSYTPASNYLGTDSFTYQANDGQATSAVATATITISLNSPPSAQSDTFYYQANRTLNVTAPGVLANDTDANGDILSALLGTGPAQGSLTLNSDGSFSYTPNPGATGVDHFTYRAYDGTASSGIANVLLADPTSASLFSDNFSRSTNTTSIDPWIIFAGNWVLTNGTLVGSSPAGGNYAIAYITNSWDDYSVETHLQFSANAYGGGISGRLNPATGARYAAWLYPIGNNLNLVKFSNWTAPSFLVLNYPVPPLGTNIHDLKLAFAGSQITVYLDGIQLVSVNDTAAPYLSGGVSAELYTDSTPYTLTLDDVTVNPLAVADSYGMNANSTLSVAAPGVLANDTGVFGTNLAASLITAPTNGIVTLNANGSFSYTPNSGFIGSDNFVYLANDGQTNLGNASVSITVFPVGNGPVLPAQTNRIVPELTPLTIVNTASDSDVPAKTLTYQLVNPPGGASIDSNGVITWTPSEAQGPGLYVLTTIVTDNSLPPLSATNSFQVTVNEINSAPVLPLQTNHTVAELTPLVVTNTATDTDLPANTLNYQLVNPPSGALIDTNGVITWTPTEAWWARVSTHNHDDRHG
ncbi:MAG: Ig-like domain-containing protein, partial [Verrucomicrobiota bacterium]